MEVQQQQNVTARRARQIAENNNEENNKEEKQILENYNDIPYQKINLISSTQAVAVQVQLSQLAKLFINLFIIHLIG